MFGRNEEIELALREMENSRIVETGSIDCIAECGLYLDYEKDSTIYRIVLGYNDLGGWVEYNGKLVDFSLEKCQTARIK